MGHSTYVPVNPLVILHTARSIGTSKPVFLTHGTFAGNDAHGMIPSPGVNRTFCVFITGKEYFLALPLFHAAKLTFTMGFGTLPGVTCVLPSAGPVTDDIVNKLHLHGNVGGTILPTSLTNELHNSPKCRENIVQLSQFVSYVEAPCIKKSVTRYLRR